MLADVAVGLEGLLVLILLVFLIVFVARRM
jgi:hypothetical protein